MNDFVNRALAHLNFEKHIEFSDAHSAKKYFADPTLSESQQLGYENSFKHAYLSAKLAQENGDYIARVLGNLREVPNTLKFYLGIGDDWRTDTFRDLYNNAVGRKIGAYAKTHNLGDQHIAKLVHAALINGDLLHDIRIENPDPRVPNVNGDPFFDFTPNDFNGWPGDFRPYLTGIRWNRPDEPDQGAASGFRGSPEAFVSLKAGGRLPAANRRPGSGLAGSPEALPSQRAGLWRSQLNNRVNPARMHERFFRTAPTTTANSGGLLNNHFNNILGQGNRTD